jgi:hypothetical protein
MCWSFGKGEKGKPQEKDRLEGDFDRGIEWHQDPGAFSKAREDRKRVKVELTLGCSLSQRTRQGSL